MVRETGRCACGARLVGDPLLEPLAGSAAPPSLGAALASLGLAAASTASMWSRPVAALAPVAIGLGIRALRAVRRDPSRHGGRRTAIAGVALAVAVALSTVVWVVRWVPHQIERRRESQAAATKADMYHLAGLVAEFRERFGAYPSRLSDLKRLEGAQAPEARDAWRGKLLYSGYTSGIASARGAVAVNTNFELRSNGPDGLPNTPDDIIMRDGSIVDPAAVAPSAPSLPVTVPVTNRSR
jgi:hypothetical protein